MVPRSARSRLELWVGLGFVTSAIVVFLAFVLTRRLLPASYVPVPIAQRPPGALTMEVFSPPDHEAPWNLQDHVDRVVIVNYFATWCGPCLRELPDLASLARKNAQRRVTIVAVSLDRDDERGAGPSRLETLARFNERYRLPFPVLMPPSDSVLLRSSIAVPQTFVYDRANRRAVHVMGPVDQRQLQGVIDALLEETP